MRAPRSISPEKHVDSNLFSAGRKASIFRNAAINLELHTRRPIVATTMNNIVHGCSGKDPGEVDMLKLSTRERSDGIFADSFRVHGDFFSSSSMEVHSRRCSHYDLALQIRAPSSIGTLVRQNLRR